MNTGLFVGREHEFIVLQILALPVTLLEVQNPTGFEGKIGSAWKQPTAMLPRTNGIFMQPAPKRRATHLGDQARGAHVLPQFVQTPAGERDVLGGGQFARQGFNLHDEFWGKRTGGDPIGNVLPIRPGVLRRSVCATG